MHLSFAEIVRKEFEKGKELTLDELYNTLSKDSRVSVVSHELGHRIRSTIYALHKSNKIERVREATYKKKANN